VLGYRLGKARRGYKRAAVAIAHKILVAVSHMLSGQVSYNDLGDLYLDKLNKSHLTRNLEHRLVPSLISNWFAPAYLAPLHSEHQFSMELSVDALGPANIELDAMRVGPRRDDKVILKLALIAVVNQVDAGINSLVLHLCIIRDIAVPLLRIIANEVGALAGQFIRTSHPGRMGPTRGQ
jgi:hypothetical protein